MPNNPLIFWAFHGFGTHRVRSNEVMTHELWATSSRPQKLCHSLQPEKAVPAPRRLMRCLRATHDRRELRNLVVCPPFLQSMAQGQ